MGAKFWIIGLLMVCSAMYLEFTTLKPTLEDLHENPKAVWETATRAENPDLVDERIIQTTFPPMLLTLKLGGIGFILSGIFLSLGGILNALELIPVRRGQMIGK
jgi:hypothetical protein